MARRSRAREIVLQVLYQEDLNPEAPDEIRKRFIKARLNHDPQMIAFAEKLLRGIRSYREQLDERLSEFATNWKLSRMAVTDRNVLRLGAYEILFTKTPGPVAVNEAINLAKRYGSQNSSQFVNGILDRMIKTKKDPKKNAVDETAPDMAEPQPKTDLPETDLPETDLPDAGQTDAAVQGVNADTAPDSAAEEATSQE